jgi:hypothetical protein
MGGNVMKTVNQRKNAIKTVLSCFALVLLLFGGLCGHSLAQDEPMVIRLGLKNPDGKYLFDPDPALAPDGDPIIMVVTVENVSGETLLASEGYADNLELLIRFADSKGFQVTAQNLLPTTSGTTLPTFPDEENERNLEGEPVERVVGPDDTPGEGEKPYPFTVEFDIRGLYLFPKPDRYTGIEYVPVGLYEEDSLIEGTSLARFHERIFGEDLISNGVDLTLIDDADGDGACVPAQHPILCPQQALPDCDDTRADIHPGMTEVLGNGLDDDCDPATPDEAAVEQGTIEIEAVNYTAEANPGAGSTPLANLQMKFFDMSAGSCAMTRSGSDWQHYDDIWSKCLPVSIEYTGNDGTALVDIAPGDYLLIAEHTPATGGPIYTGVIADGVTTDPNQTIKKYLSLITADGEVMPGIYHEIVGSHLMMIQSQYMQWPASQEKRSCPFFFESDGNWEITIELSPPKGFNVNPKSIEDVLVYSELKAVQSDITKTAKAKPKPLKVKYIIKKEKEKKKTIIESTIDMIISN